MLLLAKSLKEALRLFVFFAPLYSVAQIDKGQWIAGGNGAFSYSQSEELKQTSLLLSPSAGYFFSDRLASGLRLFYSSDTYNWNGDKTRWSGNGVTPFIRYYFLPKEQKVNLLADGSFGLAWGKYKNISESDNYSFNYHIASMMAGPAIFFNEHTALELTVGYQYSSRGPIDSSKTSTIRAGIGLQFHFGNKKN